ERHPAQTPPLDQVMDSLFGVREFKEVAVSPDGRSVGWVASLPGKADEAVTLSAIYAVELNPSLSKPHRISAGDGTAPHEEHDLVWSPDGRRLAFLSDKAKKGQLQLYVATATEGSARKLTSLKGFLARPQWSPDGKQLAVLFTENASRAAGPVQPGTPETGV